MMSKKALPLDLFQKLIAEGQKSQSTGEGEKVVETDYLKLFEGK